MTDTPDYAALARQYLDLWEEHLTAIANDPALATQMAAMFGLMAQMMPLAMPGASAIPAVGLDPLAAMKQAMAAATDGAAPATKEPGDDRSQRDTDRNGTGPQAGAAAAAAAPGDGDQRLDELARRLAAVEERLAGLASGSGGGGKKPATGAGRRKPAGRKPEERKPAKPG